MSPDLHYLPLKKDTNECVFQIIKVMTSMQNFKMKFPLECHKFNVTIVLFSMSPWKDNILI